MGNRSDDKFIALSLRAAVLTGAWWGSFELFQLVAGDRSAYFTWGRYIAAVLPVITCAIVATILISFPIMLIRWRKISREGIWAVVLVVPPTWIAGCKILLKTVSPSPRWEPEFWLGLWYVPLLLILWMALLFFILRLAAGFIIRIRFPKAAELFTGLLFLSLAVFPPIIKLWSYGPEKPEAAGLPDVIFITLDTVRADHMAAYGYFRQTTPFLDEIARDSAVFENAVSQIPYTTGSHVSIFTSRYPSELGLSRVGTQFDPDIPTITKVLNERGYLSGAFVSSIVLNHVFTQSLDFDTYDDTFSFRLWLMGTNLFFLIEVSPLSKVTEWISPEEMGGGQRRAESVTRSALQWVSKLPADRPVFLWAHYYDPHPPMEPPAPYDKLFSTTADQKTFLEKRIDFRTWREKLNTPAETIFEENNLYDGELAYMDHWIEELFDGLKKRGKNPDDAYIIIIADHGYSLGEHFYFGKASQLFDPIVCVPFFIKSPGSNGKRIADQVEAVDVMPTLLDLLGAAKPPGMRGRSLTPLMRGETSPRRPAHSETLSRPVGYSIRTPQWKLMLETEKKLPFRLFNLEEDPHELNNLSEDESLMGRPPIKKLTAWLGAWIRKYHGEINVKNAPLSQQDIEKLKALGYIE